MFHFRIRQRPIKEIAFQGNNLKFKSIQETYKAFTFLLAIAMCYPNPKTDKIRQFAIPVIILLSVPLIVICIKDISIRAKTNDMENLVRQILIILCVSFVNMKFYLTLTYKKELREIFDCISEDYASYNGLPEQYQQLVEHTIKKCTILQHFWIALIGLSSLGFPGIAVTQNIYYLLFTDTSRRFMIHECYLWDLSAEETYSTPVYEIFFAYCLLIVALVFLGFTGFDGMFLICMFHLSLKIKLVSLKVKYLMKEKADLKKIRAKIGEIVREQHKIDELKYKLLKCFELWLAAVFVVSVVQLGISLIQTTKNEHGRGTIITYLAFAGTCVAHIFYPCYVASDVTYNAALMADDIYSCSWEDVTEPAIRRSICFMIARAQKPMNFEALKLLTFNMTMFMSVMQSAYSMYTLLRG